MFDSSSELNRLALIESFPSSWPFKCLETPPHSIYSARKAGVIISYGDLVFFLNVGNLLRDAQTFWQKFLHLVGSPGLDMSCGEVDPVKNKTCPYSEISVKTLLKKLIFRNQLTHQAALYKMHICSVVGDSSTDFRIAAEYEHYFRRHVVDRRKGDVRGRMAICDLSSASKRWKASLREAALASHSRKGSTYWAIYYFHNFFCQLELLRIWTLKSIGNPPLFRKIWIRGNRLRR